MMTGSPQTDPRAEALRRGLRFEELQFDEPAIQFILTTIDAADEASGVRRVTAQELADNLELARAEARRAAFEDAATAYDMAANVVASMETANLGQSYHRMESVHELRSIAENLRSLESRPRPAADSPVGGVS